MSTILQAYRVIENGATWWQKMKLVRKPGPRGHLLNNHYTEQSYNTLAPLYYTDTHSGVH